MFFFTATATTEIYTLSLHDALPISWIRCARNSAGSDRGTPSIAERGCPVRSASRRRSEEHTSELQSHSDLVCRLLLEKKNDSNDLLDAALHTTCPHRKLTELLDSIL